MSTEQQSNPGARGETPITEQATTPTPTTTPKREKNPKRVAAGKLVAERTRLAREQQKKAAAEAAVIIANNNKAKNKAKAAASNPVSGVNPEPQGGKEEVANPQGGVGDTPTNSSLNITQWLAVAGIVVSLIGIYYKREELKAVFSKKKTPEQWGEPHTPRASNLVATTQPRGVKHLD